MALGSCESPGTGTAADLARSFEERMPPALLYLAESFTAAPPAGFRLGSGADGST